MQGELDDGRLVDGVTGARNVFKRRGQEVNPRVASRDEPARSMTGRVCCAGRAGQEPQHGRQQRRPKRLCFVMDVSSSMAIYNATDRRLDRMAAATLMIMEALHGFGHKCAAAAQRSATLPAAVLLTMAAGMTTASSGTTARHP